MKVVTIGSRGSRLALAQTRWVASELGRLRPELEVRLQIIRTTGDKMTSASLASLAAETKGLFVKEIEEALSIGTIDLAVHSLKDLPTELPPDLCLAAIPRREDPRDALASRTPMSSPWQLSRGARIGTSSLRRQVQLHHLRPDLEVVPVRGNVDTRLRKLETEGLDAVVLAAAGLRRLGLEERISCSFPVQEMVPAIGQGALALEARTADPEILTLSSLLEDSETRTAVIGERAFLSEMGGGCQVPMGAHAARNENGWSFRAFVAGKNGHPMIRGEVEVGVEMERLVESARRLALDLKNRGAAQILEEVGL